ncbi:MAG: hypothetical protein J6B19_03130 [Lachnospiraceae bacterium]|nr:hypothetical protein [Lachnospiraceae bacterium]
MTVNVAVTIITIIITMAMAVLNQGENAYTRVRRLLRSATEIVTETVTVSLTESMSERMTEITEATMIADAEHLKWKRTIVKSNT